MVAYIPDSLPVLPSQALSLTAESFQIDVFTQIGSPNLQHAIHTAPNAALYAPSYQRHHDTVNTAPLVEAANSAIGRDTSQANLFGKPANGLSSGLF